MDPKIEKSVCGLRIGITNAHKQTLWALGVVTALTPVWVEQVKWPSL